MSSNFDDYATDEQGLPRRTALKVLGAVVALQVIPRNWKKPFVSAGSAPAYAQTDLGTGDLQVTLTWECGDAQCSEGTSDMDLHVIEPGGTRVYYSNPVGPTASLDFDNVCGFGPENIFVPPGTAAAGTYRVQVHWYSGVTCRTTIQITTFDGTPGEQQTSIFRTPDSGSVYYNVADVTFPAGTIADVGGTESLTAEQLAAVKT